MGQKVHHWVKDWMNTVNSSCQLLDKLKGVTIAADDAMVSFDVVSLFHLIQLDLAARVIANRRERNPDNSLNYLESA